MYTLTEKSFLSQKLVPIQLVSVPIFLRRYFIGSLISVSVNAHLLRTSRNELHKEMFAKRITRHNHDSFVFPGWEHQSEDLIFFWYFLLHNMNRKPGNPGINSKAKSLYHSLLALLHCRTRIRTQIPNTAIGDWDPSLDLCHVNIQHVTIVAEWKALRIRVRQCKRAKYL